MLFAPAFRRTVTAAISSFALLVACDVPVGPSGGGLAGGLGPDAAADGGSSDAADAGLSGARAALCQQYASAAASCCTNMQGSCASDNAADWYSHCADYARTCAGMPTCFGGSDCNTLIYCSGGC